MDDNDTHGVRGEIGLQLSEATKGIIQPTEFDIAQDIVRSTVSANYGLSADIPKYCTDNYTTRQNIKYEHETPETTHEDNACNHQIKSVHLTTGLQTYRHLHHEINEKNIILSYKNSSKETMSTQDDSECIQIKQDIKSDHDGYGGNTDLTRYWVTCPGGILKEVKAEHKPDVSAILPDEDCGENDDQKERGQDVEMRTNVQQMHTNWKMSSNSSRGLPLIRCIRPDSVIINREQKTHKETKPLSSVRSFTCSRSLDVHSNDILYTRTEWHTSYTV